MTILHAFFCMDIIHIQISRSKSIYSRPRCFPLKRNRRSDSIASKILEEADWSFRFSGSSAFRRCLGSLLQRRFSGSAATFECMCDRALNSHSTESVTFTACGSVLRHTEFSNHVAALATRNAAVYDRVDLGRKS